MKYYELIKIEGKTPEPIVVPVPKNDSAVGNTAADNNALGAIADDIKEMKSLIEDLKNNKAVAPPTATNSQLTNDELADILNMLIYFRNKYFSYTPLATEIPRNLLWNIPKAVYDATVAMRKENCPDCLNPMYWIYVMFLEDPAYMMPMYIKSALEISPEAYNKIDELLAMVQDDYIEMGYPITEETAEADQEEDTSEEAVNEKSEEDNIDTEAKTDTDKTEEKVEEKVEVKEETTAVTTDDNKSDAPAPMFSGTTTDVKPTPVSTTPTPIPTPTPTPTPTTTTAPVTETKTDTPASTPTAPTATSAPTAPATTGAPDMYDVLLNGYAGDDVTKPDPEKYPEFNPNASKDDGMVVDKHSDDVGEITKA